MICTFTNGSCIPRVFCPQLLQHVAKLSLVFTVEHAAASAASAAFTRLVRLGLLNLSSLAGCSTALCIYSVKGGKKLFPNFGRKCRCLRPALLL